MRLLTRPGPNSGFFDAECGERDCEEYKLLIRLVEGVRQSDQSCANELYLILRERTLSWTRWRAGQDAEDLVHDAVVTVIGKIQAGELREPARLMGFVKTVLHRSISRQIRRTSRSRKRERTLEGSTELVDGRLRPDSFFEETERRRALRQAMDQLPMRERQILTLFYLDELTPPVIKMRMELTDNGFRLLKSRAKARLAKVVGAIYEVRN
jgi:RNA polymerase sigma-70 factor (ECF subfamily)